MMPCKLLKAIVAQQSWKILCLLNLMSQDNLLKLLHSLGQNKKKSDDALVLQMGINN